jgi:2-oxoglutarate ferredoxin oxidoreductase subunit alpha
MKLQHAPTATGVKTVEKAIMKGNEAIAEAAIRAGCRYYFSYPITPQTEINEYMARRMPETGGHFVQAESEIGAVNMVFGASGAGGRAMTSSSSPGIALKQEGITYLAGSELPAVIINIARGGPGIGSIQGAQSDYFQSVKGGGNGDYHVVVLAPYSVQEYADLVVLAFELADKYRNPVIVLGDGIIAQMMEPVVMPPFREYSPDKPWAVDGSRRENRRGSNLVHSAYMLPEQLEQHNIRLQDKYRRLADRETRFEELQTADADLVLVAYGISARICESVVAQARAQGLKFGLLRPVTLWPFPSARLRELAGKVPQFLCVELSAGQMVEDVALSVNGAAKVSHFGRMGSMVHIPEEILAHAVALSGG